jgi:hypothetical protein
MIGLLATVLILPAVAQPTVREKNIIRIGTDIMIPLAMAIGIFLIVAGCLGFTGVSFLIGKRIQSSSGMVLVTLLGAVILSLVRLIFWLGFMVFFIVNLFGLGSVLLTKLGTNKPWFPRKSASVS